MQLKLYRYSFKDTNKVITIEAFYREEAHAYLRSILFDMPEMDAHPLINEKIETIVSGVTEKTKDGQQYIWYNNGRNEGWMLKTDYEKIILKK